MKKIVLFILLLMGMIAARAQFSGGSGTESDPYKISTDWDLYNIRNYMGQLYDYTHFKLINDIDLTDFIAQNFPDQGWLPDRISMGKFDGDGYTISGLWINRPDVNYMGLFSQIKDDCVIKNVHIIVSPEGIQGSYAVGALVGGMVNTGTPQIRNCSVEGGLISSNNTASGMQIGGLIGSAGSMKIINCHASNNVTGIERVGGLIGQAAFTTIDSCSASGTIQVASTVTNSLNLGGLIGAVSSYPSMPVTISNSSSTGNIINNHGSSVGGFIGYADGNIIIANSYSTGNINNNYGMYIGGFIGHSQVYAIKNCYSTGNIINENGPAFNRGGFIGLCSLNSFYGDSSGIYKCYSMGNVEGDSQIGGFIGELYGRGMIKDCYARGNIKAINFADFNYTGGFIGSLSESYIQNCYSTGIVEALPGEYVAGFIGFQTQASRELTNNCYYDQQTSSQSVGINGCIYCGVNSKNTSQMKTQSTYIDWDFNQVWKIDDGQEYPVFQEWKEIFCFEGGDGSRENAYQIKTAEQLNCLRNYVGQNYKDTYFELIDNIDLTTFIEQNYPYEGWLPIGSRHDEFNPNMTLPDQFMGEFDGGGYTISGLWIDRWNTPFVGLFSWVNGGSTFKNVHIIVDQKGIVGLSCVGALVGTAMTTHLKKTEINNCNVEGGLIRSNTTDAGSLIGYGEEINIINCHTSNDVYGYGKIGGLIGQAVSATIDSCSASGNIQALNTMQDANNTGIGGLIGTVSEYHNNSKTISNSNSTGSIIAEYCTSVGGFIGWHGGKININNCHSTGSITTNNSSNVGGFIGLSEGYSAAICNNYYAGSIIGNYSNSVGGFIGMCRGNDTISNNYNTGDITNHYGSSIGGFTGSYEAETIISDNHNTGNIINNSGSYVGGFIGSYTKGMVEKCYSTGNIINQSGFGYSIGGFIGNIQHSYNSPGIFKCYTTGNVEGGYDVGGFIGSVLPNYGFIEDCYARGNVIAIGDKRNISGFIGYWESSSTTMQNCYSSAVVEAEPGPYVAGFIGYMGVYYWSPISNCYYDEQTSGQPLGIDSSYEDMDHSITPKNTFEMRSQSTFAGFDFNNVWKISEGCSYPIFQWQDFEECCAEGFAGGTGSKNDPWLIKYPKQLNDMKNYLGSANGTKYFKLIADIDLSDYIVSPQGWEPIGTNANRFQATLHGDGHIITNLWINRPDSNIVGLFGVIGPQGKVENIGVEVDPSKQIIGNNYTGILAGLVTNNATVSACYTKGNVSGTQHVGGFVGDNRGVIENCYSQSYVTAVRWGGGFIGGSTAAGTTANCYTASKAEGNVSGGFVGNYAGTINSSYFDITVNENTDGVGAGAGTGTPTVKNTTEMKRKKTYAGWNFNKIWSIDEGNDYPVLQWQLNNQGYSIPFATAIIMETPAEITVYPNPTTGMVNIVTDAQSPEVKVYNTNNNLILQANSTTIDLSPYRKGVYIFNINGKMEKVIKQ